MAQSTGEQATEPSWQGETRGLGVSAGLGWGEAPRGSAAFSYDGKKPEGREPRASCSPDPVLRGKNAAPMLLPRPPPWGKAPTPKPGRRSPHQADAAEAGVQEGREGLVVVEDLSHVGTSCQEESRVAALEAPRLAGSGGSGSARLPPTAPLVPVTCRAVGAALPGDVDGVGARLHAVRPLAAH